MLVNETYWGCEIIAHRGGAGINPQNTMAAFVQANTWADSFECDVQTSADGTLWVFHDITVDALTGGTGTFTALSDSYIETLDVAGEPLLRFSDFLTYSQSVGKTIYPEIKGNGAVTREPISDAVVAAGMASKCILQSFEMVDVKWVLDNTVIQAGYLANTTDLPSLEWYVDELEPYDGRGWVLSAYPGIEAQPSLIAYADAADVSISVWTVPSQAQLNNLRNLGVTSAMVDYVFEGVAR